MPGSERSLRSDALRNRIRILVAAESVFAAKGLDASTDEVARLAGVGIGTLYRHFATKDALLDAVFAGRMQRLVDRADDLARESDAGRAFFDFFAGLLGESPRDRVFTDALARAGLDAEAAATRPDNPLHIAMAQLLERAQRSGQVRPDVSVPDLVSSMFGLVHAMRHAGTATRVRLRTLTIVVDGLRPPAGTQRRVKASVPVGRRRR
ncbi:TetR family transcriptional regulator [Virgisporangium aliadipatigenens]|uniref:TetR family transcriptional regulator n=1 Tax=Virgisporangium aliadipatigenens TaxID=741659 RepID=A0A8J4DNN5_9ACTN|nr:TetR family transcriptional regulator [Virgisporangium aliadipatigenens]